MNFRKLIVSCILFSIILVQFGDGIIWMGFQFNRKYISQTLCENALSRISICNGSCFLKKEIKRNHQKQASSNSKINLVLALMDNSLEIQNRFPLSTKNEFLDRVPEVILQPSLLFLRPPANCI